MGLTTCEKCKRIMEGSETSTGVHLPSFCGCDREVKPLPCPFCGLDAAVVHPDSLTQFGYQMGQPDLDPFYIHCDSCGAEGPQADSEQEAVENWNKRDGDKCRHGCKITRMVKAMTDSLGE